DLGSSQLDVLGQTVLFDAVTEFDEVTAETLAVGDIVEISGYATDDGEFYATRIELETPDDDFKVRGTISALDTSAETFLLGDLTIQYGTAEFDDLTPDALQNGLAVRVEGEDRKRVV